MQREISELEQISYLRSREVELAGWQASLSPNDSLNLQYATVQNCLMPQHRFTHHKGLGCLNARRASLRFDAFSLRAILGRWWCAHYCKKGEAFHPLSSALFFYPLDPLGCRQWGGPPCETHSFPFSLLAFWLGSIIRCRTWARLSDIAVTFSCLVLSFDGPSHGMSKCVMDLIRSFST